MFRRLIECIVSKFKKKCAYPIWCEATPVEVKQWPFRRGKCHLLNDKVTTFCFSALLENKRIYLSGFGRECSVGTDPFVGTMSQAYHEAGRRAVLYEQLTGNKIISVQYDRLEELCQN